MKVILIPLGITIFLFFNCNFSNAQVSENLYLYVDQIPVPPASCKDAMNFVNYNQESNEIKLTQQIDTLDQLFEKMYTKLSKKSENIKENLRKRIENEDNGQGNRMPPNGIPQGDMKDVMTDFHKTDRLQVKLEEAEVKFRNDMQTQQNSVNTEIKKTLANDVDGRVKIVDNFLSNVNKVYSEFILQLKQDFKELDEVTEKYDYGEDKGRLLLKKKIIDIQLLETKNLRLLMSCVKGSIKIGSEFYTKTK